MTIEIRASEGGYVASVTPPHGAWETDEPLSAWGVVSKLAELGCHSTDIMDALSSADPKAIERYNAEVVLRRAQDDR